MNEKNEIIVLEQLPIITARLDFVSEKIKEKVQASLNLVCNEETVKDIKKVRADLNKEFQELEAQRKQIKNAIMEKYNDFETLYKEKVSYLYNLADEKLKAKILSVEDELKKEKEEEIREFFEEHCKDKNVNVQFERMGLNITLSASMKSLKEQALSFIERVATDLKMIEMEEYKDEILLEYNSTLDFAKSKMVVIERHKQIEELQRQKEELVKKEEEEQKVVEIVEQVIEEEITAPQEIIEEDELLTITFTITDTKENIIKVREFMKKEGIKYE